MRQKTWYTIYLAQYQIIEGQSIQTYRGDIAKVRSKGLAFIVKECLKLHYLPTAYTVEME